MKLRVRQSSFIHRFGGPHGDIVCFPFWQLMVDLDEWMADSTQKMLAIGEMQHGLVFAPAYRKPYGTALRQRPPALVQLRPRAYR